MLYKWAVIGAGAAGIAAVGKLIDHGILPKEIAWIDPDFKVGDLGKKWHYVSSNTRVKLFLQFLQESDAFDFIHHPAFEMYSLPLNKTCQLQYMVEPLQWITDHFKNSVNYKQDKATKLTLSQQRWQIDLMDENIFAKNVILAIGAEPKTLNYPNIETISLETALDITRLPLICTKKDVVAVFGSSHSTMNVLRNLTETTSVQQIINFYRSPLRYAIPFGDDFLFDDTGLKGDSAEWARKNIDGQLPDNLKRVYASSENIDTYLPLCNKVIYTIGFERRKSIHIHGFPYIDYNPQTGIVAPGLFGLGIAFPEKRADQFGIEEYKIGLWKFMDYLNRILPVWLKYHG